MATTPVFVGKLWNNLEKCYENVKFIYIGYDKTRDINVLLVGIDDVTSIRVIMQPTWVVREWMDRGLHTEMSNKDVETLMRACKVVPPLAKKIWDKALSH